MALHAWSSLIACTMHIHVPEESHKLLSTTYNGQYKQSIYKNKHVNNAYNYSLVPRQIFLYNGREKTTSACVLLIHYNVDNLER